MEQVRGGIDCLRVDHELIGADREQQSGVQSRRCQSDAAQLFPSPDAQRGGHHQHQRQLLARAARIVSARWVCGSTCLVDWAD